MHSGATFIGKAWLVVLIVSCTVPSCGRFESTDTLSDLAIVETLWLPAGAALENRSDGFSPVLVYNGRSIYSDGSAGVVFLVAGSCDDVAGAIATHFGQTEWRPRSVQYLNPSEATSFNTGCERRGGGIVWPDSEGRPVPTGPYREWRGEWENERGDIVTYTIGGTGEQLRGLASYNPREVVDAAKRKRDG